MLIGTALFVGFVSIGAYFGLRPEGGDPSGWFLAAGLTIGAVVVICVFYFGLQPLMLTLQRWRLRTIANLREEIEALPQTAPTSIGTSASPGSLYVTSAIWGIESTWARVEDVLASKIVNGQLTIQATNEKLGNDPVPGQPKTLRVIYRVGNAPQRTASVSEGDILHIPSP